MSKAADVLVVGGGPAGSIAALLLRRLGFCVQLVEAHGRPRQHVGEAISAGVIRQLRNLGIAAVLERSGWQPFTQCDERWSDETMSVRDAPPGSATIDRARFDAALWDTCREAGLAVSLGRRVMSLDRQNGGGWLACLSDGERCTAAFLVDATGRRGLLRKARRQRGPRTIALYGYWKGDRLPSRPRVAAGPTCWAWGAPVSGLGFNATVLVDRRSLAEHDDLRALYCSGLVATGLLSFVQCPSDCPPVVACDAGAWVDDEAVGHDFIKVGEAAQSLDPLASMGVQKAIQSARSAAIVVNTMLRRPTAWTIARNYYQDRLNRSARAHRRAVSEIYAQSRFSDEPFWRARVETVTEPSDTVPTDRPPLASTTLIHLEPLRLVEQPSLCGEYVELRAAVLAGEEREPVSFFGDVEVGVLIDQARRSTTFGELLDSLAEDYGARAAERIGAWLVDKGILHLSGTTTTLG